MPELSRKAIQGVLEELEDFLEERKREDRRQRHDPANEYSHPANDRRSGLDRRAG